MTLCHGDTHIQNTYVLPDGSVGLYDWQLSLRAAWARDVSYILGTALGADQRRAHEHALLRYYLRELGARLPPGQAAPEFDAAWKLYSQSMAWGLVIGWLICPPNNYGKAIWLGNVDRLVQACVDLDTFPLLGIGQARTCE